MSNPKGFVSPLIVLLTVLPLIGFFLGTKYRPIDNLPSLQSNSNECNKQLTEKETEINMCIQDSASVTDSLKSPYDFKDFGLYSTLFQGKEIASQVYKYKKQNITRKELVLDKNEQGNSISGVIVWEYTSMNSTVGSDPNYTYVIFGGYENNGVHPTAVNLNAKDQESYINSKNIKMIWGYEYCPKSICRATLSFLSKYTPSGHSIYVQLWANNPDYLKESGLNSPGLNQIKNQLKKIADTVEDSSTHH